MLQYVSIYLFWATVADCRTTCSLHVQSSFCRNLFSGTGASKTVLRLRERPQDVGSQGLAPQRDEDVLRLGGRLEWVINKDNNKQQ